MGVRLIKRQFPSGSVRLFLDINSNGKRKKEALGLSLGGNRFNNRETLKMAEEIRARRELELHEQMHGVLHASKRKQSFVNYFEKLLGTKNALNTRSSWEDALTHFRDFAGADVIFGQLTREFLEGFKSYLLKEGELSPNSAQIYFSRIKTALNQAVKDSIISSNPAAFVTIKKKPHLPTYLHFGEISTLAKTKTSNENVKNAFLFSCFSGLRYSDIISLTWDNVKDGYLIFSQRKTGNPERLPLSEQARRILEDQKTMQPSMRVKRPQPDKVVFYLPRQSVIDKQLKKWAKDAELGKSLSMHVGRHTFATLAISNGVDIYTTSKLLGHRDLHSTQIYAKVIDESKRNAVDKLPHL
ncbi:MAG TPA: site-specific integrase [Bacteroidota bacterium]|nr:site-specific integrase [Bacteroidota bacterium]